MLGDPFGDSSIERRAFERIAVDFSRLGRSDYPEGARAEKRNGWHLNPKKNGPGRPVNSLQKSAQQWVQLRRRIIVLNIGRLGDRQCPKTAQSGVYTVKIYGRARLSYVYGLSIQHLFPRLLRRRKGNAPAGCRIKPLTIQTNRDRPANSDHWRRLRNRCRRRPLSARDKDCRGRNQGEKQSYFVFQHGDTSVLVWIAGRKPAS